MKFFTVLWIFFICQSAAEVDKTAARRATKTDHEKQLLKFVADNINHILREADSGKIQGFKEGQINEDHGLRLESEVRALETLAQAIIDVSDQFKKRNTYQIMDARLPGKPTGSPQMFGSVDFKKPAEVPVNMESSVKPTNILEFKNDADAVTEKFGDASKAALKLTPKIVFTDTEGNEFRLVGAGGRSVESCSGHCLSVDRDSKSVLAFKYPGPGEHLVIAGRNGEEYFTNGVQLCDDSGIKKSVNLYKSANLGLLVPKSNIQLNRDRLFVEWQGDKAAEVKRENPLVYNEFNKEVNTLFNGVGLKNSAAVRLTGEHLADPSNTSRMKKGRRRKHARIYKRRKNVDLHGRNTREASDDYYYDDGDDSLVNVSPARTDLELKLIEGLKKDKQTLKKFGKPQKSIMDLDTCKKHCEAMTMRLRESLTKGYSAKRTKRSLDNPTQQSEARPMTSGQNFRVFEVKPKGIIEINGQNLLGEINMVQPESSTDVENQLVLKTKKEKATNPRQTPQDVDKLDKNVAEENTPDLVVAEDENTFPESDNSSGSDDSALDDSQPESIDAERPLPAATQEPSSSEVGAQIAESILFRAQNIDIIKQTLGAGLRINAPKAPEESVPQHGPDYSSTIQILLRTLMLNVEKLAEEDVQRRSCLTLDTDLQDFLDKLVNFPGHPNMPSQYEANMTPATSLSSLALRKNELMDLLKEYRNLPLKAQQHASGVKSFIETEVRDIDKLLSNQPKSDQNIVP